MTGSTSASRWRRNEKGEERSDPLYRRDEGRGKKRLSPLTYREEKMQASLMERRGEGKATPA